VHFCSLRFSNNLTIDPDGNWGIGIPLVPCNYCQYRTRDQILFSSCVVLAASTKYQ